MNAVRVVPYDPCWPTIFEQLRARLWPAVADLALSIEHVGSTAVPGLAAKPIIDIDVVIPDVVPMGAAVTRLAMLGYVSQGDLGVTGREAFRSPETLARHHLYACAQGSLALRNHLAVRDRLRADPVLAQAYSALKTELAREHPTGLTAYTERKTAAILELLRMDGFSPEDLAAIEAVNTRTKRS